MILLFSRMSRSSKRRALRACLRSRELEQNKAQRPTGVTAEGWPEGRAQRVKTGEGAEFRPLNEHRSPVFNAVMPTRSRS
ncbi:hypothetical protein FCN13_05575 [Pseudomonas sp. UMC631]|nr:hypothetical protein [Pseudomonas sp. UMA643]NTY17587.1 hypothetical protein [Pseudomonas sp. UMC3103]NTY23157.1 hypothetical protein [Pseudomonas sp. UMA603]NTY31149.1 hypothetical protein [Pseudomonas sp. UMC3129]NTY53073.1 hypothetical protein [Pseudomonas sp. UMC631]NTY65477.1 hypothetical protein [Pseudomonas sp. UMC3106]NUA34038.1 hypothetical protein [Pseudomonas sp. UMA601]